MAVSESFRDFVLDQLHLLGKVDARKMFGGAGLYLREVFFGILFDDVLYLKVDDSNRGDYLEAKMKPFRPFRRRKSSLKYYQVPAGVLEDREKLKFWAEKSVRAAAVGRSSPRRRPGWRGGKRSETP